MYQYMQNYVWDTLFGVTHVLQMFSTFDMLIWCFTYRLTTKVNEWYAGTKIVIFIMKLNWLTTKVNNNTNF